MDHGCHSTDQSQGCPSAAAVRAWLEGDGSGAGGPGLSAHLANCAACQAEFDREAAWGGSGPWPWPAPEPGDAGEAALVARLRALPPPASLAPRPPRPAQAPLPESIGGYRVERRAGQGGMGTVYEARDLRLNRRVAIKVLHPATLAAGLDRFLREASVLAALGHPNIVPIYEIGEHAGQPFLVLEYVAGGTLASWAAGRACPAREAAAALATLARAVQFAHDRGVIHRDLKPSNVLLDPGPRLDPDGPVTPGPMVPERLRIVDFGLARWRNESSDLTRTGEPIGTPDYMAPEQVDGRRAGIGPAIDIHALGAVLFELLTGRPPFQAETLAATLSLVVAAEPPAPRALRPGLPRDLETIALKCLEKEPKRRYASASALADDLDRFLAGRPITARPPGIAGRGWRWCQRNPVPAGLAALSLALAVISLGLILGQRVLQSEAQTLRMAVLARGDDARVALADKRRALEQALFALSGISARLADEAPGTSPWVQSLRQASLRQAIGWTEQRLQTAGPVEHWDATEVQVSLLLARFRAELGETAPARQAMALGRQAGQRLLRDDPARTEVAVPLATACLYEALDILSHESREAARSDLAELDGILDAYVERRGAEAEPLRRRFRELAAAALTLDRARSGSGPDTAWQGHVAILTAALQGRCRHELGYQTEALQVLDRAAELLGREPADAPGSATLQGIRAGVLADRAAVRGQLGQFDAALEDLEALGTLAVDPVEQARQLARLAGLAAGDPARSDRIAARAIAVLDQARAANPLDPAAIRTLIVESPEFRPLRSRPDLRRLLLALDHATDL